MNKPITGLLIDVEHKNVEVKTLDGSLDDYYEVLHCSYIEIISRRIGEGLREFDIVYDGEGMFKNEARVSAVDNSCEPIMMGNLFITGLVDEEGYPKDLSNDDVTYLFKFIRLGSTYNHPDPYPILYQCVY